MPTGLSDAVIRFIHEHVDSLDVLEVLFLLHRSAKGWTVRELASELRLDPSSVRGCAEGLVEHGLATRSADPDPFYVYEPSNSELNDGVLALERAYAERRVAVLTAIFSRPHDRVQLFADAFRLKKDKG